MLKFREYGAHIHHWAEKLNTEMEDVRRHALAKEIIRMMATISPGQHDSDEYQRKLWDHLYMITNYKYDLGSPFPTPSPPTEEITITRHIDYQKAEKGISQYGSLVKYLIQRAIAISDEQARLELVNVIVNVMKQVMSNTRQTSLRDETLLEHLSQLSQGKLVYSREQLEIRSVQRHGNQQFNNQHRRNNNQFKHRSKNQFDKNRHKRK